MDAIGSGGLEEFGRRLRAGETSARAAVESCLARIEAEDNALRSFVHVAADAARRSADTIDRRLSAGEELGPLMGVPVAVKDLFAVEGMPASAGSRLDVALVIGNEGPFVKRLKEIGAVVLGKTRTIEFAAGGHNLGHPIPCNPADRSRHRSPGGSSSGSAVAVAAGLCPLAVGSDTGGSVESSGSALRHHRLQVHLRSLFDGRCLPALPFYGLRWLVRRSAGRSFGSTGGH